MQQLQLSIPQPCHQNWQHMTSTEQGRFCNACAKEVIDFSTMTDKEVLTYFTSKKNEKVCGRAYPDQLERAITSPKEFKKKKFWYWNYIAMGLLFFSKANMSKAQVGKIRVETSALKGDTVVTEQTVKQAIPNNVPKTISGLITDENDTPIGFAAIKIKGTNIGVSTNADGRYAIKVNTKKDVLEISAIGYTKVELALNTLQTYNLKLTAEERQLLGDIVVVGYMSNSDYEYTNVAIPNHVAIVKVIDNETLNGVAMASVEVKQIGYNKRDTAFTDKKGVYKMKKIKDDETYNLLITAEGYLPQQLVIKGSNFNNRKEVMQVFLEKAVALIDYKKMDAVTVTDYGTRGCRTHTMGAVAVVGETLNTVTVKKTIIDSIQLFATKITGALKVFPNPVIKGNTVTLLLKLKQTGKYGIQITNAFGVVVLQQQINATAKDAKEMIQTDSRWSSGIYFVRVFNEANKLVSTNNLIVQ